MRLTQPRLYPIPESEWNEVQSQMLRPFKSRSKDGRVFNIFTTLIRHPKLFASWTAFGAHILSTSTLSPREREILILRIGWLCRSEYEFGQHALIGKKAGLTDDDILRVTKSQDSKGWDPFEAVLIRAADELHKDAFIKDETWELLSERYDKQQLMDLIFTVGQYTMVCMALNSCGIQLDPDMPGFPANAG